MNEVFQALSDPTRREILRLLRHKDMTAGEIAAHFSLAKSTLSGHFRLLKHAGLIVSEKAGNRVVYSLNVSAFEEMLAALFDLFDIGREGSEKQGRKTKKRTGNKAKQRSGLSGNRTAGRSRK